MLTPIASGPGCRLSRRSSWLSAGTTEAERHRYSADALNGPGPEAAGLWTDKSARVPAGNMQQSSAGIAGTSLADAPTHGGSASVRDGSGRGGRVCHGGRGSAASDRAGQADRGEAPHRFCLQAAAAEIFG